MRIGLVIDSMEGGGAERMNLNLVSGLIARGHQVDLLLFRPTGPYLASIPTVVRVITLNIRVWSQRRQLRYFHRHIPASVRVVHMGPRWSGKWITWFRAAVALRWPWKDLWLFTPGVARAVIGIAQYIRRERPRAIMASLRTSTTATLLAKRWAGREVR
ncbi:MAG: hypothetical protein OXU54_02430, partial [Gammaproteobacteria bacterium]|nr:hypothetical protein [Gammaproteobacteria bacterium]